jgi:hypothetical protein
MTRKEAIDFARGMFGEDGATRVMEDCISSYGIGHVEGREFYSLGWGESWEEAADACVTEADFCARHGVDPHEMPF